jgi:hypothetical protein
MYSKRLQGEMIGNELETAGCSVQSTAYDPRVQCTCQWLRSVEASNHCKWEFFKQTLAFIPNQFNSTHINLTSRYNRFDFEHEQLLQQCPLNIQINIR